LYDDGAPPAPAKSLAGSNDIAGRLVTSTAMQKAFLEEDFAKLEVLSKKFAML
jgi:hypothetical protein